ncbi:MAG: NADH-quinone oxidoreductase subunit F, partial [Clostridia bacterium]|nr:NADH-quinone oxidoreductase subunit F [Clostridia bacterium]
MKIVVGQGSCGIAAGAGKIYDLIENANPSCELTITGCIGMCFVEPIVDIYDDEGKLKRLVRVKDSDAEKIVEAVEKKDLSIVDYLEISDDDNSFLTQQTRVALRHCGVINPEKIEDYIADDGYQAIEKVLKTMTPEDVIEEIKISGLAGRGGAGFPTWFKWNAAKQATGEKKYLIC